MVSLFFGYGERIMITFEKQTVETVKLELPIPDSIMMQFSDRLQVELDPHQLYDIGDGKYRIESVEVRKGLSHHLIHSNHNTEVLFRRIYEVVK